MVINTLQYDARYTQRQISPLLSYGLRSFKAGRLGASHLPNYNALADQTKKKSALDTSRTEKVCQAALLGSSPTKNKLSICQFIADKYIHANLSKLQRFVSIKINISLPQWLFTSDCSYCSLVLTDYAISSSSSSSSHSLSYDRSKAPSKASSPKSPI